MLKTKMSEQEYTQTVQQCREDLYRFAVRYTADGDGAWDTVQDAFVALWTHREEVKADKAKGWMIRVMYRQLVDQHRRTERFRNIAPELVQEEWYSQHDNFELHDAMQKALNQLTEQHRAILLMKDLEGYQYQEIAQLTGLDVPQVTGILYRARINLKKAYLKLNNINQHAI
jgi:RNA polymerase sigma-70 factor (ECF subfamily)